MTPFGINIGATPLNKYPLPSGSVSYNGVNASDYQEWQIAMAYGCDLERWYTLDRYARAAMIATWMAVKETEAADYDVHKRESEAKSKRG